MKEMWLYYVFQNSFVPRNEKECTHDSEVRVSIASCSAITYPTKRKM